MDRPQMLSTGMIERALEDPSFRFACPEFSALPIPAPAKPSTCSGCKGRSQQTSKTSTFFKIAAELDTVGMDRLKAYFGIGKLMLSVRNPITNGVALKVV